jgi:hypothetical protein
VQDRLSPSNVSTSVPPVAPAAASNATPADPLSADERAQFDRAIASGRLEIPAAIRSLARPSGTLLGTPTSSTTLAPLSPVGTAVISASPEFTWQQVDGARTYSIAVFDSQFNEVAHSPRVSAPKWQPAKPLPRGITLAWQITAHFPDHDVLAPQPPAPEARFMVAGDAAAASATALRAKYVDSPLLLGVLLASSGFVSDATVELNRAAADPSTAERAQAFLASLKK